MNHTRSTLLTVEAQETPKGITIFVDGKPFAIEYPGTVWKRLPKNLRKVLLENIAYAETNWLPLILNKPGVHYNTSRPLFESIFQMNQMYDMLSCEVLDKVPHLSYMRRFYNLDFEFNVTVATALPITYYTKNKTTKRIIKPVAIIPFTFGKESLTTLALCHELGIRPILFYCQEPVQPYEEKYKIAKLAELKKRFNVDYYFVKHEPGLFRYGRAFRAAQRSELGWGAQVGLLTLLAMPFVWMYDARYILVGNEFSNNEHEMRRDWRVYLSADQTASMTETYNTITRLLSTGRCELKSSLEPLQEIDIFYILHNRYPDIGSLQFSCSAEKPLYRQSQWCHKCYKCCRMYLFAKAVGIDPAIIGFQKNLLDNIKIWKHYFGKERQTGSVDELTFAFYVLYRHGDDSLCTRLFAKTHLRRVQSWQWYRKKYTSLHAAHNLPAEYQTKLFAIFKEELNSLKTKLT